MSFLDDFSDAEEAAAEKRNKEYTDAEYGYIKDCKYIEFNGTLTEWDSITNIEKD